MKKFLISSAFFAVLVLVLTGCKKDEDKDFTITTPVLNMEVGGTTQIGLTPATETYVFASVDPSVVSVNATGMVTALKEGSTMINVSLGKTQKSVLVSVGPKQFTIANSLIYLTVGETEQIGVTPAGEAYTFTSLHTAIATVNATGRVTAVSVGTATINVALGSLVKTVSVEVSAEPRTVVVVDLSKFTSADDIFWSGEALRANIEFEEDCEIVFRGFTDLQTSTGYNRDFMTYDAESGEFTFTGESGEWLIIWSERYNYFWVAKEWGAYPECYWMIGHGFISAVKWHDDLYEEGEWDFWDFRQMAYMKPLGDGKYQTSVWLNPYHDWGTWGFDIYGDRDWSDRCTPTTFTGDSSDKIVVEYKEVDGEQVPWSVASMDGFEDGFYRLTLDSKAKSVHFERIANP